MSSADENQAVNPQTEPGAVIAFEDVSKDAAEVMATRRQMVSEVRPATKPNIRRSAPAVRWFYGLLVLVLALVAGAVGFYVKNIAPALASVGVAAAAGPVAAPVRAVEIQLPDAFRNELAKASSQIAELQQQIDGFRALQATHEKRFESMTERLESLPPVGPVMSTTEAAGVSSAAAEKPLGESLSSSPAMAEMRLLKERNRLTAHADEAISTGLRRPLELITEAMKDPARATLYHAGKAEYYRVVGHFHLMNRIDPGYQLPVGLLFPEAEVRDEADLKTEQLMGLLADQEKDWQVRLRAAFLLGGRRTLEVGEALVKAMKEDPSLDVAKEAQLSFQQNMGRNFLLFDLAAIESWWETQTVLRPADEAKP